MTDEQKRVRRLHDRLRKFGERVEVEVAELKSLFPPNPSGSSFGDGVSGELGRMMSDLEAACLSAKNAVGLASDYAIRRRAQ